MNFFVKKEMKFEKRKKNKYMRQLIAKDKKWQEVSLFFPQAQSFYGSLQWMSKIVEKKSPKTVEEVL